MIPHLVAEDVSLQDPARDDHLPNPKVHFRTLVLITGRFDNPPALVIIDNTLITVDNDLITPR